jgi:protease IV
MVEQKEGKGGITHYLGIGVAIATILSVVGSYTFLFFILFSSRSKPWVVIEKGVETAKIAVINIRGPIMDEAGSYGSTSLYQMIKNALKDIKNDKAVKAVVWRINSPGGEATYTDRIYNEVMRFRRENPTIKFFSFVESMAASGGFYLAAVSDYIMAEPQSIVGSIGVFFGKVNLQKLFDKVGIQIEIIKSSSKKDFGSVARAMTPEEQEMMSKIIMSMYERFVDVVSNSRKAKLTREQVKSLSDGSVFTGLEGVLNGLVDETGYFQDLLEKVKQIIGKKDAKVSEYLPKKSIFEQFFAEKLKFGKGFEEIFLKSISNNVWLLWEGYILR